MLSIYAGDFDTQNNLQTCNHKMFHVKQNLPAADIPGFLIINTWRYFILSRLSRNDFGQPVSQGNGVKYCRQHTANFYFPDTEDINANSKN